MPNGRGRGALKSDKRQTYILIGIGLMAVAAVLLYAALSQPSFVAQPESSGTSAQSAASFVLSGDPVPSGTSSAVQTDSPQNTAQTAAYTYPINLNTATMEQLLSVDGIGESRAAQILAYREELGGYTSVEQIKNISGIGDAVYAKIAPYLTV